MNDGRKLFALRDERGQGEGKKRPTIDS